MTRQYFDKEMRYLHEAGKAFAEAHPEVGRYLNVDSLSDRDPYVERLFEGFAFLTGRVHERLDDALPEYTESLLELLYPHFLRPVPSLCMLELKPKAGLVQETTLLAAGTEVRSAPVGDEHTICRFATTHPVRLQPLQLSDVEIRYASGAGSSLRLDFKLDRGADFAALELSPLRVYLHADVATAATAHAHLTAHVSHVVLSAPDGQPIVLEGQHWVKPGGLGADDGILPYGPRSFSGLRLLQEYLTFRPKFWCVDLTGLERLPSPEGLSRFAIEIHFDRSYPEDKRLRLENVRLFCAPAINLFSMDAEPVRVEGYLSEYRLTASVRHRRSVEIYDVEEVVGIEDVTGNRHVYTPFFAHERNGSKGRFYTVRRRLGAAGTPEIYLALSAGSLESEAGLRPETLSLRVRATNGSVPKERLREGMLSELAPDTPPIVRPNNLSAPTLILYPPTTEDPDYFWKLISHLSFNFMSAASREALLGLLNLYDWTPTEANRRRLNGIRDVAWEGKEEMYRGAILRGAEVTLKIDERTFPDEGDLRLFGLVLSTFLSHAATINSFVHLKVVLQPSGKEYSWQPRRGSMPIL